MTKKFGCGKAGFHNRKETMAARRFINETLLPSLEREFAEEAKGNKHSLVRFEDAMRGMTRFIESHRDHWDANEIG